MEIFEIWFLRFDFLKIRSYLQSYDAWWIIRDNLSSCFDSGYIEQLSEKYKLYINDIYTVKNTDIAGDANNDGVITAADIVIIKRYILCAVNKSSMESRGYSLKNSDLNSDNKINILDLQKLYRLLLKWYHRQN